jgi:hypothetical protein
LLAVTFVLGPVQIGFASPASAQCAEQASLTNDGCCDDALPEFTCGSTCPTSGQAWMTPPGRHFSSPDRTIAFAAMPAPRPRSNARPPDTAPPKFLSA